MDGNDPRLYLSFMDELQKLAASKHRMAVPQTRSGRRSMRVDTMLKKDREGTLFKHWHDHLPGGLADKKKPTEFDPKALAQGKTVESEHTSSPALATEIAMDHLTEDPSYYPKLRKMEKEGGLSDLLKMPIPGTKDWVVNTSKRPLQGMATIAKRTASTMPPARPSGVRPALRQPGTRTMSGVTHISESELKRLGFDDLTKSGAAENKQTFKLQGHTSVQGIPVSIENRKGSVRKGVDPDGKPWRTKFKLPYGYIPGTLGNDGEEIDAYVGPHKTAPNAFVIHQRNITGKGFDEDKVMLGFEDIEEARKFYLDHYNGVGKKLLGPISTITINELKRRLDEKREHKKLATVDISNTSLYADRTGPQQPKKPNDIPDAEGSDAPTSKLAWDGVGSGAGPISSTMARIDQDEKPDRRQKGDVPSRDGTSPGQATTVKHEAGPDFAATVPTAASLSMSTSSESGPTTRM